MQPLGLHPRQPVDVVPRGVPQGEGPDPVRPDRAEHRVERTEAQHVRVEEDRRPDAGLQGVELEERGREALGEPLRWPVPEGREEGPDVQAREVVGVRRGGRVVGHQRERQPRVPPSYGGERHHHRAEVHVERRGGDVGALGRVDVGEGDGSRPVRTHVADPTVRRRAGSGPALLDVGCAPGSPRLVRRSRLLSGAP